MVHIDDLIQSGAEEEVLLSTVPSLFRPHRESPDRASRDQRITILGPFQFAYVDGQGAEAELTRIED